MRIGCYRLGCLLTSEHALKLLVVVLDVAQVVSALGDGSTEPLLEPRKFLCGELRVLLTHVSDVKLVIESISIPTESFSKEIRGCSLADEAGYSEETCDAGPNSLEKFRFFILVFLVAVIMRCRSYLPFALSGDDLQN